MDFQAAGVFFTAEMRERKEKKMTQFVGKKYSENATITSL